MALNSGLLTRLRAMQIKVEATKGTAESASLLEELVFDPVMRPTASFITRAGSGKKLGQTNPGVVSGMEGGECTFTMELRSTGSAAFTPGLTAALTGCGLLNTSETFTPESDLGTQKTVTIMLFEDQRKKTLVGAMGNVEIFNDGDDRRILCEFTFIGRWAGQIDEVLPTIDHAATAPMKFGSTQGSFSMAGDAVFISQFRFATNNELFLRPDAASAGGIKHAMIGQRDPTLVIDPESQLVTDNALYATWLAGSEVVASLVVADGTDDVTFAIPQFQYRELTTGDRDGLLIEDVTGQMNTNAIDVGDDSFSIAIAVA